MLLCLPRSYLSLFRSVYTSPFSPQRPSSVPRQADNMETTRETNKKDIVKAAGAVKAADTPDAAKAAEDDWTIKRLLIVAFLIRVLFIFYAGIHDYMFKARILIVLSPLSLFQVKFTDIDYAVYSDAAVHVYNGRSPFERATYRYSPVLAYLVLPNIFYADFGRPRIDKFKQPSIDFREVLVLGYRYLDRGVALSQRHEVCHNLWAFWTIQDGSVYLLAL